MKIFHATPDINHGTLTSKRLMQHPVTTLLLPWNLLEYSRLLYSMTPKKDNYSYYLITLLTHWNTGNNHPFLCVILYRKL